YQQATNSTVTIQKRVDGFELIMGDPYFNQVRHGVLLVVHKALQVGYQFGNAFVMRRNKNSISQAAAAYPVLALPVLTRQFVLSPYAIEEDLMRLPKQTVAQRQLFQAFNRFVHSLDIVLYLLP